PLGHNGFQDRLFQPLRHPAGQIPNIPVTDRDVNSELPEGTLLIRLITRTEPQAIEIERFIIFCYEGGSILSYGGETIGTIFTQAISDGVYDYVWIYADL
ncbi:MAG: hypothetical protein HOH43_07510, partial [Candidatus Latescibacteria bacterium]|nr:hypothetical protein [Candidatus Latescibacterota bacterium]